jgi:unsaturated chondroitin disaccharide hydrolase
MVLSEVQMEPVDLLNDIKHFWDFSGQKLDLLEATYNWKDGAPVYTEQGVYTSRGWTEWTEGFVYGSMILQFDATENVKYLNMGRSYTVDKMASHITHTGVHDHGFNNISTYGNLLRLAEEGRIAAADWEKEFYKLALRVSGAVQAVRWTELHAGAGYIQSFNGPHSLFADTIRSLRSLALAHQLGQVLKGENDVAITLLERLISHAKTTSDYIVYYGKGRDIYDLSGRVIHEAIFNTKDGNFRCPNTQQGYSPFSTWTRGLTWIITGYAEQLEFIRILDDTELLPYGGREEIEGFMARTCRVAADFYLNNCGTDGIPYWDTGAPGLKKLGDWRNRPADPFNHFEPVDSSAAAIASQGLMRFGRYLNFDGSNNGDVYFTKGLEILKVLLNKPYLSSGDSHQGLLLHSVYHRPNGWDYCPDKDGVPRGESSMWGDYHLREAALFVQRIAENKPYYKFFL